MKAVLARQDGCIRPMQTFPEFGKGPRLHDKSCPASEVITRHREAFDQICASLLQNEVIDGDEVNGIVARWRGIQG
jgi:hypothetical protein